MVRAKHLNLGQFCIRSVERGKGKESKEQMRTEIGEVHLLLLWSRTSLVPNKSTVIRLIFKYSELKYSICARQATSLFSWHIIFLSIK